MEYPKMDKLGKLDRGFICKNFTGQVSSVIIFSEHIKRQNAVEIMQKFPKGINPEKLLEEIENNSKLKEDKIKEKLFSVLVPGRAQKSVHGEDIYVEFSNTTNKAKLGPLAGVFSQDSQKNQFLFWGELKALLPIMTLFKNIKDERLGRLTFQKFLDIICTFTDLLTKENIKDFTLEDFFGGFFHLFYWIPINFFSKQTVDSLIEIRFKLIEDSAFFSNLIYTTDLWFNLDFETQDFYWDYIKQIYSQDPIHYLECVSIEKLLHIVKHLTQYKRGPCCQKHRDINDRRFARRSSKHLPPTNLSEYIRPILRIIKWILVENAANKRISSCVWELTQCLVYKSIPWFKIEILKVLLELITQDEAWAFIFKSNLKEEKHYYLILKTFQESYYDVQTYCAEIIKIIDLEYDTKEKVFSFLNYSVCPPEERGIDIHHTDANFYHSPIFTNKIGNILEQTEEMKENTNAVTTTRNTKFKYRQKVTFDQSSDEKNQDSSKKEKEYDVKDIDPSSSTSYGKLTELKLYIYRQPKTDWVFTKPILIRRVSNCVTKRPW